MFTFLEKRKQIHIANTLVFKYRNLNEEAITHIKEYLDNSDWSDLHDMVLDNAFETVVNGVNRSIDTFVPEILRRLI